MCRFDGQPCLFPYLIIYDMAVPLESYLFQLLQSRSISLCPSSHSYSLHGDAADNYGTCALVDGSDNVLLVAHPRTRRYEFSLPLGVRECSLDLSR